MLPGGGRVTCAVASRSPVVNKPQCSRRAVRNLLAAGSKDQHRNQQEGRGVALVSSSEATTRTVVVALDDASAAQGLSELRSRLGEVLGAADARLVVDVSGLERVSSGVVAALLWTKRRCLARGVEVSVRGASSRSLLLTRTGLSDVLDVEPTTGRR
jgi:anti-anti-sigma regulatory factor